MRKLKNFRVKPSSSDIYAVSLVEDEAVESGFVALSKQKQPMNFKIHNEEKRMLYGVALRANFPIYRCYENDEFYLTFDANAIERLVNKFMSNYCQKSFTIDHMEPADGIVITESWLVKDTENDKSNALGLENVSEGSWIIGCKINNDEIWQSIREGRWHGFSVEAFCDLEEIKKEIKNKKIENKMAVKKSKFDEMMDQIKAIISDAVENAEGQDMEVKEDVVDEATDAVEEVVNQQENTTVVDAAEEEQKPTEEVANEVIDTVEQQAETEQDAAENLQEVVNQLQEEIDTLKAENEQLKKKNQKMSKKPSTKVVNANAETKQTGIQAAFASLKAQGLINF